MITINTIDGIIFAQMMISGSNNLYNHKDEVNELNVFPVPDGDTGINMSLTVTAVANELLDFNEKSLTKVADKISFATLRGARGNSGVILSQLFRGISKSLKGKDSTDAVGFAEAFAEGAAAAYKAVMKPTEGTILTVAREAATGAVEAAAAGADLSETICACAERGGIALEKTPEQLPALKEAGVVDAGGQGWLYIIEGMRDYLLNNEVVKSETSSQETPKKQSAQASVSTSDIKFKYCTEFIIEKYDVGSEVDSFRDAISLLGDCMLVIDDEEVVKVHIHTNNPGIVLEQAVKLGEMINIKIDNMKHQHKSIIEEKPKTEVKVVASAPEKEYGFVAVCVGKGIAEILKDLGVDYIIEGGQTMNPSTDDFLKAVAKVPAKTIFLFPNNKNIILAASQAKELSGKNLIVIPTRSIPQCVSAMVSFSDDKSPELNERAMNKAASAVKTGQITFAVRDTEVDKKPIKKGDILGIAEGKINVIGKNPEEVLEMLVEDMTDEDSEFITVYCGKGLKKQAVAEIQEKLEILYPDCEIIFQKGGQPLYYYIVSVE